MRAIAVIPGQPDSVHLAETATRASAGVEAVGPSVTEVQPGDFVGATVRRPGTSLLEFVLGNKVMVGTVNANRMAQAESEYPGWLARLLTHPVRGLDRYRELFDALVTARGAIKVFCEVAALDGEGVGGGA